MARQDKTRKDRTTVQDKKRTRNKRQDKARRNTRQDKTTQCTSQKTQDINTRA